MYATIDEVWDACKKEWREEGRKEGRQEGWQEGRQEGARAMMVAYARKTHDVAVAEALREFLASFTWLPDISFDDLDILIEHHVQGGDMRSRWQQYRETSLASTDTLQRIEGTS